MSQINSNYSAKITAIMAMSIDGKISPATEKAARFSTPADLIHLEQQVALCDAIIFGAATLRAYGTTITVKNPQLLAERQQRKQSPQPLNIVCSSSGNLDPSCPFFNQSVTRILLTTYRGLISWQSLSQNILSSESGFETIIVSEKSDNQTINWRNTLSQFQAMNLRNIGVLGGSQLFTSLLAENLIDELWLTVCPLIFGNSKATNLVSHNLPFHVRLNLLDVKVIESEIFLHYQVKSS